MYVQKSIGIIICGVLTLSAITGCGNSTANQNTSENGAEAEITTNAAETEIATEAPYKYDEVVFYQTPSCKISFKDIAINSDDYREFVDLTFLAEAESTADDVVNYETYGLIINGYKMREYKAYSSGSFYVDPGLKEVFHSQIPKVAFEEAGIDKIETIEFDNKYLQVGVTVNIPGIDFNDTHYEELTGNCLTLDPPFELNWEMTE